MINVENEKIVGAEDFKEPMCPFDGDFYTNEEPSEKIPVRRVIERLDELLYEKKDYAGALRHLEYWERCAEAGRDLRGLLTVENELMGFHRQNGTKEGAFHAVERGIEIVEKLGMADTVGGATTYLNAATVCKAYGDAERAVLYYETARAVYERELDRNDARLAGLYNNCALALCDLCRFDEAEKMYGAALDIVSGDVDRRLEAAITYLNLADLYYKKIGALDAEDTVDMYLDSAEKIFFDESVPHNGYYAYVCEKSAPTFEYYGRFLTAKKLYERAHTRHEGT